MDIDKSEMKMKGYTYTLYKYIPENSDVKIEDFTQASPIHGKPDESANKPKRKRGRPRKKQ